MEIAISKIVTGERRRTVDASSAAQLAHSITQIGLLNPITVVSENGSYRLLAGAHRLEAYRILERETIPANIVEAGALESELIEIDENLIHNPLSKLEQGEHLQRRNEILEAMGARREVGRYPSNGDTVSPLKTTADIAAEIGISERGAQRLTQAARDIIPEVKDAIRDTKAADSTTLLLDLSRLDKEQQEEVVEKIEQGATPRDAVDEVKKPHVLHNSGNNEWYTPPEYTEAARLVMGGIDLDPASSNIANETVNASTYYTLEDDGLQKQWAGRVWMNPPYSGGSMDKFIDKFVAHYTAGDITQAVVLTNNATETGWFQDLLSCAGALCLVKGRIKFITCEGKKPNSPIQGQAVMYFGNDVESFARVFLSFGTVLYVR